jgi:prophage regulatory protein
MRYIRFPQLAAEKGIGFSRMHVDRLEKAGKFPKRVKISERAVGWIEEEVDTWQQQKADARAAA